MKASQIFSAFVAIHHVQASTNLRHGASNKGILALNTDRFAQGHFSHHGILQPVRQHQDNYFSFEAIFGADSFGDDNRNLQQCDFCGSQGSCGRTIPLSDFFSVTVEDSEPSSSWLVSCLHSNRIAPNCYYSPDGEGNITSIPPEAKFEDIILSCPNECCTWAYPRSKWAGLPVTDTVACDGETTCREIAKICHLQGTFTKTFSCPVGTFMYLEGGAGSITVTVGSDAKVVAASDKCNPAVNGVICPYSRRALSIAALIAADDCNCITCDGRGKVREGTCSTPIPSYLPSEGQCTTTADVIDDCFDNMTLSNDTEVSFSLTARNSSIAQRKNETLTSERDDGDTNGTASVVTPNTTTSNFSLIDTDTMDDNETGIANETFVDPWESNSSSTAELDAENMDDNVTQVTNETITDPLESNSTSSLSDLAQAERDEMLGQATRAKAAMEALQKSIEDGTLTTAEKLTLLQTIEDALVALQTAISTADAYQPINPTYCFGVIATIQDKKNMLSCGITNECITGAKMLQALTVDVLLLAEIINSQLVE